MARITIYRRHTETCCGKHGWVHTPECQAQNAGKKQKHCNCPVPDREYKRCDCPIWFYRTEDGKKQRWASGEREWKDAEALAQKLEAGEAHQHHAQGKTTLAEVIALFLADKEKGSDKVAPDTLYRHKAVLTLLAEFCTNRGKTHLHQITLSDITEWQHTWKLESPAAKRSRQEKIRNFFRFCLNHGHISTNPLINWKSVKLENNGDLAVSEDRIIRPKVYEKIMKAIDSTPMTPENRVRIKTCMRLQREAGLAIVDAVTLHKTELVKEAAKYRIKTSRQKTGKAVNNPITEELGRILLTVKNGNPEYFFWSGHTLPEDAPSYFQKLYRKVFKQAGVEHTSHDLRHTYAATFLEAGGDIRLLSKALGHGSVTITERYYGHLTKKQQDMLDQAAEKALTAMTSSGD